MWAQTNMAASEYLYAHNTIITALENMTDPFELSGLVLRLDYLIRTLVDLDDDLRTVEIIRLLGKTCNELTDIEAQSRLTEAEAGRTSPSNLHSTPWKTSL